MKLNNGREITSIPTLSLTEEQRVNMTRWIAALRSGKYPQGALLLRSAEGHYCCLGVACDVATVPGTSWKKKGEGHVIWEFISPQERDAEIPPLDIREHYGFPKQWGFTVQIKTSEDSDFPANLTDLNDAYGATFEDIANIAEIAMNGGLGETE